MDDEIRFTEKVKERMMIAFQRKGLPWIMMKLIDSFGDKWFSSTEASKVLSKARHHTLETLKGLEEKGYLTSKKVKIFSRATLIGTPVRRLFKVTEKGRKLIELFSSLLFSLLPF